MNTAYLNTQKQIRIINLVQPYLDMGFQYGSCDCHTITAEIIDSIRGTNYADSIKGKYSDLESANRYHSSGELKLNTVLDTEFDEVQNLEPMDLIVFPSPDSHAHLLWYIGDGTCLVANQNTNRIQTSPVPDLAEARLYRLKQ